MTTVQTTIETQIISHSPKSFSEVIAKIEGLYLPVRVLVYEGSDGETCVVCDRPSAQLGEMAQNATARTVAETLDAALEELVERCVLMES